jgi:anti-sigma factor NepR-like protein
MSWNPVEDTQAVKVARALGWHLQQYYSDFLREPLPQDLAALLQRLDDSSERRKARIAA